MRLTLLAPALLLLCALSAQAQTDAAAAAAKEPGAVVKPSGLVFLSLQCHVHFREHSERF